MERNFPKNVRQVGNVSDTPKIYVEDYVDTYLNQLKDQAKEQTVGAFLIGESLTIEEQECVYITGAVRIEALKGDGPEIEISDQMWQRAEEDRRNYFQDGEIIGWFLIMPGRPLNLNASLVHTHERLFPQRNSILILKDAAEDEEQYFAYKYRELLQMGGHYIFYEKNPSMQNYMIHTRKQNGVTPSEVVEDRAAKNFRSTIRGKIEAQEYKANARFAYATSILLVVVVLAIGISAMNNYDKMNAVQSSIETLSKSVAGTDGASSGNAQAADDAKTGQAAGKNEEPAADTAADPDNGTDGQDDANAPSDAAAETITDSVQDMEPFTSTIQEELDDSDYYIVQKGDTLGQISQKIYGTTNKSEEICEANGLTDGNLIFIGQRLLLP